MTSQSRHHTHLEDAYEVLFVDTEEMAVVLSQDDGGGARSVVQQSQLPEVLALVKRRHQSLGAHGARFRVTSPTAAPQKAVLTSGDPALLGLVWDIHLPVCDHVDGAFPDDVPRGALVALTEHCIPKDERQNKSAASKGHRDLREGHIYTATFRKWAPLSMCDFHIFKIKCAE